MKKRLRGPQPASPGPESVTPKQGTEQGFRNCAGPGGGGTDHDPVKVSCHGSSEPSRAPACSCIAKVRHPRDLVLICELLSLCPGASQGPASALATRNSRTPPRIVTVIPRPLEADALNTVETAGRGRASRIPGQRQSERLCQLCCKHSHLYSFNELSCRSTEDDSAVTQLWGSGNFHIVPPPFPRASEPFASVLKRKEKACPFPKSPPQEVPCITYTHIL